MCVCCVCLRVYVYVCVCVFMFMCVFMFVCLFVVRLCLSAARAVLGESSLQKASLGCSSSKQVFTFAEEQR
jgi:hypothetical protein